MLTRIEIFDKPSFEDSIGKRLLSEFETIGINSVSKVSVVHVYKINGSFLENDVKTICDKLLVDGTTQDYAIKNNGSTITDNSAVLSEKNSIIEVSRKLGVMDPVEQSVLKGISDMGFSASSVKTSKRYLISGTLTDGQLNTIGYKILGNSTIEDIFFDREALSIDDKAQQIGCNQYVFKKIEIDLLGSGDEELKEISQKFTLSLNIDEMRSVKNHFANLKRNPTDAELETIAQTWSEHCVHKTFKGTIDYNGEIINDLLASTIVKATDDLDKEWCVSVFKDNAGIIRFDEDYNICFKAETHNHPSAIEPYGGASTGIGGVIRDVLGTGLGGRPILNTDVFCFAHPDMPQNDLPTGTLHPKRIFNGVVSGVRDYGNRMGIPTANGAIFFDKRYVANPLVFCGTVGLIPTDRCEKESVVGDLIILVGGRTGRDGIHGVTFASAGLEKDSETVSSGSVQIGNPITEKKVTDVLLQVRDKGLYNCITDCGGGGLSSAIGEMGEDLGVEVNLDKVPLKYDGLTYTEIWISEAQERMVLAVPPKNEEAVIAMFREEDVEATTIGRFTGDKKLRLLYGSDCVGSLDMDFLHNGLPKIVRKAEWKLPLFDEPVLNSVKTDGQLKSYNYGNDLKKILASWNVCSKERVIREYDHEVQGSSVLKPLQGVENDGPGDACVIAPIHGSKKGVIVSNGMNPMYGDIDPYHMAASAIDEALRQIISVGGNLDQVALLDNFCWGNTERPECLGGLVRAAQACHDYSLQYGTPFISGKDSLYNETEICLANNKRSIIAIPHTLLISAVSVMDDVTKAVSMDVKSTGNLIYIVGLTKPELGGSHYYHIKGAIGNSVPTVETKLGKKVMTSLSSATEIGIVSSCHDCSEGGLTVAAAEMSFAGGFGMDLSLCNVPVSDKDVSEEVVLFSESNSRFIVEIKPEHRDKFENILCDAPIGLIGTVSDSKDFSVRGRDNSVLISENIFDLKEAWQSTLKKL